MLATPVQDIQIQDMQVDYNQLGRFLKSAADAADNFIRHPGAFMHPTPISGATGPALQ